MRRFKDEDVVVCVERVLPLVCVLRRFGVIEELFDPPLDPVAGLRGDVDHGGTRRTHTGENAA